MDPRSYEAIDVALDTLGRFGFESELAGSTHAPMVAEALCALGRADAVMPWIATYLPRLTRRAELTGSLATEEWRDSLGRFERLGGWIRLFESELDEKPFREVLDLWLPRLAPGAAAAAMHGLIRTAHATRALAVAETRVRRRELSEALAYWAARYFRLPGTPSLTGQLDPPQALRHTPALALRAGQVRPTDMMSGLAAMYGHPKFADRVNLVAAPKNASAFLSQVAETSAAAFMANENGFPAAVAFLHCVTATSAVRMLTPYASEKTTVDLASYCWQAVSGLYAAFGPVTPIVAEPETDTPKIQMRAVEVGIGVGDPHVIKFAEACIREHEVSGSPVFLAAAERATVILADHPT